MADITSWLDQLIAREGDYSDHRADRGGPTRWGITEAVARANGYAGEMRLLPRAEAERIYRALYWEAPRFDVIAPLAPRIAQELLDAGVNMGQAVAIRFLQRALNALNRNGRDYPDLTPDGMIGSVTINALTRFLSVRGMKGEAALLKAMQALRGERYIALAEGRPENEAFVYGWLANRIG
mgnify:FL=1